MEVRFNETRAIEKIERSDGSLASRVPVSRRHYQVCLLIGLIMLPLFAACPLLSESFSVVFTIGWSLGAVLFFVVWFWAAFAYLRDPDRFGLEIDVDGVRERLLTKELYWRWSDIERVQLFDVDTVKVVGFVLKQKGWQRRWRISKFDAVLSNQYAVAQAIAEMN